MGTSKGFALRYGVVSGLVLAVIALVVSQVLAALIAGRALSQAEQSAVLAVGLGVAPHVQPTDLDGAPGDEIRAGLDRALTLGGSDFAPGSQDNRLVALKVFDTAGTVVYSDRRDQVGRTFASDELDAALQGRIVSRTTRVGGADGAGEAEALDVYVPLTAGGTRPYGVAEVYLSYAPVQRAVQRDTLILYACLTAGLLIFYLTLFRMVVDASRRLTRQTAQLQESAASNHHLARHDALTSLPNRSLLNERLDAALVEARASGDGLTVMLIDLDRFKEVNDTLGHDTGDLLLCEVGNRLHDALREVDTVARLGGDEFVVLLPDSSPGHAELVAERLLAELHRSFVVNGLELAVEASIGVALHPGHGETAGELLQHADVARYAAKESRGAYALYDGSTEGSTTSRMGLLADLRRALDEGELVVHYQPKVEVSDGSVRSLEALVRWQHPTRGLTPPDEFVPAAEQTGLIWPLTRFVISAALLQVRAWLDEGHDLRVAVNLSARNLSDVRLPALVEHMLREAGVEASRLDVEITESSAMVDPARAAQVLRGLSALGVGVAVDDYGTGFSSLSYLRSLPVDTLKIDRSFVTTMLSDENNAVIVHSTIELAHALGLKTVAEGVEDAETYAALVALGCGGIQGYHLSRPMAGKDVGSFIEAQGPLTVPG